MNAAPDKPRLILRADGNTQIGLGHIVRCLALADMLAARFICRFVVRATSPELRQQIKDSGYQLVEVPEEVAPGLPEAGWLVRQRQGNELVVLDGYTFSFEYQQVISRQQYGLACLDDLITAPIWADLVLNQAGGVAATRYAVAPGAALCLGPAYALLRPPFQAAAGRQTIPSAWTGRIFLNMGGADPGNETLAVLRQLLAAFPGHEIAVVTGAAYPHQASLRPVAGQAAAVRLHHSLPAGVLSNLVKTCDLLVCPPSGMAYECCAIGGLVLLHRTAENQQAMYDFLTTNGLALPLVALTEQLARAAPDLAALAARQRQRQQQLFDGQSDTRLLVAFTELENTARLTIRRATAADCRQYFAWANDAGVRRNAVQTDPIVWTSHEAWFGRRLADADAYLYVLASAGQLVGQVRVEFEGGVGTIDYSVAAEWRGRGLGLRLLRRALHRLRHERPGTWTLRGQVKSQNQASSRVFERLRFNRQQPVVVAGQPYEVFELGVNSGLLTLV